MASPPSPSSPPATPPPFSLPIAPDLGGGAHNHHRRRRTRSFCSSSSSVSPLSSFSSFSSSSSGVSFLGYHLAPPSPSPSPPTLSSVPFSWEDQPGVPKAKPGGSDNKDNPTASAEPAAAGHRMETPGRSTSRELPPYSPPSQPHRTLRPPPLRANCSDHFGPAAASRWRRRLGLPDPGHIRDPFAVALIQCSKHRAPADEQDALDADAELLSVASAPATPSTTSTSGTRQGQRRHVQQLPARKSALPSGIAAAASKFYAPASCKTSCAVIESAAVLIPRAVRRPGGAKWHEYDLLRRRPM